MWLNYPGRCDYGISIALKWKVGGFWTDSCSKRIPYSTELLHKFKQELMHAFKSKMSFLVSFCSTWRMAIPAVMLRKISCLYGVSLKVGVLSFSSSSSMLIVEFTSLLGGKRSLAVTCKNDAVRRLCCSKAFCGSSKKDEWELQAEESGISSGISLQITLLSTSAFISSTKLLIHTQGSASCQDRSGLTCWPQVTLGKEQACF